MNIWRLQTKTSGCGKDTQICDYCVKNSVIAMGWSLIYSEHEQERNNIKTWEDYIELNNTICREKGWKESVDENVLRFHNEIEENDLVWLKQNGIYYLGRISSNSKWKFCTEATDIDACNQIDNVQFVTVGDESSVAGVIATSFIRNMTLQHIWLDGAKEFSCYTFDKLNNSEFYKDEYKLDFTRDVFFNLISPDDCEDLLVSFLFSKYNYMLIPSTAKKGTELYEFVMKDIKNGSNIYAQVKKGDMPLDGNDYKKLINNGEKIYLLSTRGIVSNHNDRDIVKVDPELLFNFAIDKNNEKFLTSNIIMWKNMLYAKSEEGAD